MLLVMLTVVLRKIPRKGHVDVLCLSFLHIILDFLMRIGLHPLMNTMKIMKIA